MADDSVSLSNEYLRLYENEILHAFKWPLRFAQVLGYVNFRGQQLTALGSDELPPRPEDAARTSKGETRTNWLWFKRALLYCRIAAYQILVSGLQLFLGINYWIGSSDYSDNAFKLLGRLEKSIMIGASVLQLMWPVSVKLLHGFVSARQALKFWRTTTSELEFGITDIRNPNSELLGLPDDHKRSFQTLRISTRNATIIRLVIWGIYSLLHDLIPVLYFLFSSASAGTSFNRSRLYPMVCEIIWSLLTLGHPALSVWISNFLKLYATCIEILALELEKLPHEHVPRPTQGKGIVLGEMSSKVRPCQIRSVDFRDSEMEDRLTACIRFYYTVEAQLDNFNSFFGLILIGEILWYITLGIIICFYLHLSIMSNELTGTSADRAVAGGLYFLLFALAIYDYCSSASLVHVESKRVLVRLQDISLCKMNFDLRQMVHVLITKITTSPPEPSPGMYFTINRNLITLIASALSTYLVILIQFRSSGEGMK